MMASGWLKLGFKLPLSYLKALFLSCGTTALSFAYIDFQPFIPVYTSTSEALKSQ